MTRRYLAFVGMSAALVTALLAATPRLASAQTAHLAITALNGAKTAITYVAPKTPWGDPDLQGTWTSDDMRGVGTARQKQYGDRLYLTDQEFAERVKRDETARRRGDNDIGTFRNDVGTRTWRQTSLIVDPPDGQFPAVTPYAETRRATRDRGTFGDGPFNTTEDFTLYDRCITRGIVGGVLPVPYGNGNRIVQAPGMVVISYEMVHDTRVIYTDGRPHIGQGVRQLLGDSRGHWEGNTLVVESTNFTDKTSIGANGNGLRHSIDMTITERITRLAEDVVQYEVTVNDPKTYTRPFTISMPLTPLRGNLLLPYECHEGNYGLPNALSAERAEDKAIEEDRKNGIVRARRAIQVAIPNRPEAPAVEGSESGR
ncbi:MAG TPA: hypothetical protein VI485_07690 [Vicinamibacterales bacterium]|nr:hypothetical protein [Vicinamibacterales bacterium]